jgi:oligoribonuclease (3'-5' exoribonuclease)
MRSFSEPLTRQGFDVQSLHTAMADIKQSVEQLRYYKETVFKTKHRRH